MRNLLATFDDVGLDSLQFATPVIVSGSKRYQVVVHACTGQGTKCSGDANSNLAGIGETRGSGQAKCLCHQAAAMLAMRQAWRAASAHYEMPAADAYAHCCGCVVCLPCWRPRWASVPNTGLALLAAPLLQVSPPSRRTWPSQPG